ncbi:MAG: hypothetical protein QY331_01750 [Melioribacteraceae bacterium]|nr:MAG: hypothetical protein QY331_01750 [Melioribacteraceae bacterium]
MDFWGNDNREKPVEVNIYADEIMSKKCPYLGHSWHYIGILAEDLDNPLLQNIVAERYCNNFDMSSPYYKKNNKPVHWADISSADEKNICKRWFQYILNTSLSGKIFYCYILGINDSNLNKEEFDPNNNFNSKYNRFFRSSIKYALKCFFGNKKILIKNIFHEQGQQQLHEYFPWHTIHKLNLGEPNFYFDTKEIQFLQKDHRIDEKSNLIQLCDCFMGAVTNIIHGFEESNRAKYRIELLELLLPLVQRMLREPNNKKSSYLHSNRIIMRFFPKEKTDLADFRRDINQFYTIRKLKYEDDISGQESFSF